MCAVVIIWPLIECPQHSQVWDYIFQKRFFVLRIHSKRQLWHIYRKNTLDTVCFHPLSGCPLTPSQLTPSNLIKNILFLIHKKYRIQNYSSRHRACRNRQTKVPEGPWMVDPGVARPGWRSEKPNMQPLTPVT
jgi:hypothetical protein